MNTSTTSTTQLHGRRLTLTYYAWYACAVFAAIVLLGALPSYYTHYAQVLRVASNNLGELKLSLQVLVGLSDLASSFISFALAVLLFWRKPNDRMALFASFFFLLTAIVSSYALDYFLTAYFGAPSTYELGSSLQTPLWILIFCIFPAGHFVPRWTRWIFLVSIPASFAIFAGAEMRSIFIVATYPLFFLILYAQVYRYRRVSSAAERKQTKWVVVFGVVVSMALSVIASLLYKEFSPPLINIIPLALTIAILRSHLWDIDVLIRKTLTYAIVGALLAIVYFSSIILLQQLFAQIIGERSEIFTILSTLAIAALFVPLRNKIQEGIDRRFYRKKYDAQKVLQKFAETVRDETDLDKLTGELVRVVQETMQPKSVSVWLKRTTDDRQRTEI